MILELKKIIDSAESVTVLLAKPKAEGGHYTATLLVKGGTPEVPPLQVKGTIEELDDAISKVFNEAAEVYAGANADIEAFKAATAKQVEAAKAKPAATTASKTPAKKAAKPATKKAVSTPAAKEEPGIGLELGDDEMDEETKAAMEKLLNA